MENTELTPLEPSALQAMEEANISQQIATAKRYPRVLSKVKQDMMSFATLDEATASACFYTLKRRNKDGTQKIIQGPSIRIAEIAASCYGNIRAGARVVSNDGKTITCQGVCHDLEKNVYFSMETTRRITTTEGKTFSDDMQVVTQNAACAIALRNAICKTVPLALITPVLEEAKRVAVGDVKSLAAKREKVIARLKQMGADQDAILSAVDARKIDDITLDKLETLIGLGTALKDGDTTLEEAFPVAKVVPAFAQPSPPPTSTTTPAPASETVSQTPEGTPQNRLMDIVREAGFGFAELNEWAIGTGNLDQPLATIDDLPAETAQKWLKAKTGLLKGLTEARKAMGA